MRAPASGLGFPEGPIALAGGGSRTAFVTSSGRGILYTLQWITTGLDLEFMA